MNRNCKAISLIFASMLVSSLALAAPTSGASTSTAHPEATTKAVDCSKDKSGKPATQEQVKKCEAKAKGTANY